MARHPRFFREDFDRNRTFVALKPFVFSGQGYVPGQQLDTSKTTSLFTDRRLRQLYDTRFVGYQEGASEPLPAPPTVKKVGVGVPRRRLREPNGLAT
jgi:hypothetical protein